MGVILLRGQQGGARETAEKEDARVGGHHGRQAGKARWPAEGEGAVMARFYPIAGVCR